MNEDRTSKVLGVLGGMGPLASQLFYKMVIEKTDAHRDQDHVDMILFSHATMPDRTAAIKAEDTEELFSMLLADVKSLAENGVSAIAIPCNTSHLFVDRLQEHLEIPIVHMIRETVKKIREQYKTEEPRIGILATDGTISTKLYQSECRKSGIEPITPSPENQKLVMKIIYDGIKNGGIIDYADFQKIEDEFKDLGCHGAIMGCTELSCFKELFRLPDFYIDAMAVLAERSIELCGKKIRR